MDNTQTHVWNIMGESSYKDSMILLDKLCVKILGRIYLPLSPNYVLTCIKNKI
jgi:hypothetical protein